tara:strand:- start:44 stop:703 length:660 start_codon:yes stop_codon:yes gene_type:complete
MDVNTDIIRTHNNLVELGKERQKLDTIKKNRDEYLETLLSEFKDYSDKIDLVNSLDGIINNLENTYLDSNNGFKFISNNVIFSKYILAVYLLEDKLLETEKEVNLLKDTEEDLQEQYDDIIEELNHLEEVFELYKNTTYYSNSLFCFLFFVYNYILYFSFDDIYNHFLCFFETIFNLIYIFVFEGYIINMMMILSFLYSFKVMSDVVINYLSDCKIKKN